MDRRTDGPLSFCNELSLENVLPQFNYRQSGSANMLLQRKVKLGSDRRLFDRRLIR